MIDKDKLLALVLILVLLITGCSMQDNNNVRIPKGYIDSQEYFDKDGFQDYTDYAKYIYSSKNVIVDNKEYKKITSEDIENIIGYFDNFHDWMETSNRLNEYDFEKSIINEGDYIKIITKEGKNIGNAKYEKYDDYSVYFFDIETNTLYYIHNNI